VHGAIALWARADWRRRSRTLVALTLLTGFAGAVVLTAIAGARRTATSFERFAEEASAADVAADLGAVDSQIVDDLAHLPIVDASGSFTIVFALVDGVEADLAMWIPRDDRVGVEIERFRVLRGRTPDPGRPEEVVVNEAAAAVVGVDVGDEVDVATLTPEQVLAEEYFPPRGPTLPFQVVGVVRGTDDIVEGAEGGFFASPALYDVVHGQVDEFTTYLGVTLVDGASVEDFDAAVADVVPPEQEFQSLSLEQRSNALRGTISAVASGLAVFALAAAVAASVAVGQAVGRHVAGAQADAEVLQGLGVTSFARSVALVLMSVPVAVGGATVAVVGAWLASPIMPMGLARRAEPDPGLAADWPVLVGGGLAIVAMVLLAAALAAAWLARAQLASQTQRRPSAMAAAIGRAGGGPVPTNGVRLALDRRAPALPVRSAIGGVAVAIVGDVAVVTFSASLDRLLATPDRWGFGWDLLLNFTTDEVDAAAERLVDDERVSAAARWDGGFSYVDGAVVRAYGLTPLTGDIGFALRSGRQPVTPGEVVLGPATAERLGVDLGDRVEVAQEAQTADTAPVVVVGTALFPDDGEGSFAGAVGYYDTAFAEHAIAPDLFEASQMVVRLPRGLDVQATAAALDEDYPDSVSGESLPIPPAEVSNLESIRALPRWLAAFVAVLGIASLVHVLVTTVRRRRGELATLRTLGITPQQTLGCIVWQAATITALGVAVGLPLGLIAGDAAWFSITDPSGLATDTDRPVLLYITMGVLALLIAVIVALAPGRWAGRQRLADGLRAE
jgi:FtsX-like permease family